MDNKESSNQFSSNVGSYILSDLDDQEEQKANCLFYWLIGGIVFFVVSYAVYLIQCKWSAEKGFEVAGQFGDSFGILTSLFSGIAFAGLIWTILLQRLELRLQRKELIETRRQAILTRLMTVTQNQVNAYRGEITSLQFENIVSPGEFVGTNEMIFTMTAYLEQFAQKSENSEKTDGNEFVNFLLLVAKSNRSYQALIQGLKRCCKSNRHLLINESITPEEAQDIKSQMFAELPSGLMEFILHLYTALDAYQNKVSKIELFDPMRSLHMDCGLILGHKSHVFTQENMQSDKKQKWLFMQ